MGHRDPKDALRVRLQSVEDLMISLELVVIAIRNCRSGVVVNGYQRACDG